MALGQQYGGLTGKVDPRRDPGLRRLPGAPGAFVAYIAVALFTLSMGPRVKHQGLPRWSTAPQHLSKQFFQETRYFQPWSLESPEVGKLVHGSAIGDGPSMEWKV